MDGFYKLSSQTTATANSQMNNKSVKNLWHSFTFTEATIDFNPCDNFTFKIGNTTTPTLPLGKEYALTVDRDGVAIIGKDYGGLMRGFISLLMKIEQRSNDIVIKHTVEQSQYILPNRMIHLCVFPENDLYFIQKMIRLAAVCQYTHIVIEFWGMLKFDCLKELSWPQSFTKQQARKLVCECRELGIEPIPMFNQLGHASASRLRHGKHVVLDQNPKLQRLFTPDGWAWDIKSDEVKALLRNIRKELYDVFGDGEYIHIGCDEAYFISRNAELRKSLPSFLHELTLEVEKEGRRPMLWMDMLLEKNAFKNCCTAGEKDEVEKLRNSTAKSSVFIDWQYDCFEAPIESLLSLKDCGHDVLGAPWFKQPNYCAHIETLVQNNMSGIMLTTWDTVSANTRSIHDCAKKCGAVFYDWSEYALLHTLGATLLRKVSFEGNTYANSGWSKQQIQM